MRYVVCWIVLLGVAAVAPGAAADWGARVAKLADANGEGLAALKKEIVAGGIDAHAALAEGPDATWALRLELRRQIRKARDEAARKRGLVVHEWGAVGFGQGVEGGRLDLGTDASDLPEFVQRWDEIARQRGGADDPNAGGENAAPGVKIEIIKKPIIYFYSDRPETMRVDVGCPNGLLTTWWPKATKVMPDPFDGSVTDMKAALDQGGAVLTWRNFELQPAAAAEADGPAAPVELPAVPAHAWWWPICRDTDSTLVNVNGTLEKFLFYRGILAGAEPALKVDGGAGQKYGVTNTLRGEAVRHVLAVHVAGGKARYRYIASIAPGAKAALDMGAAAKDLKATTAADLRERLADLLEDEGLFPKEAAGMSKIWQKPWFEDGGLRVIFFSPRGATESLLPLRIDPKPAQVVRTLLVGVECLKDSKENVVAELIRQLGDGDFGEREAAQRKLIQLGRANEKALGDALRKADDEEVRQRLSTVLRRISAAAEEPPKVDDDNEGEK
ncbi:MAG TPA: hypothetical protein VEA69_08205 [Tepidisphaeraceae bacterium]|nr:hypothetical protein [Tepidisphaeraceae bacterium]